MSSVARMKSLKKRFKNALNLGASGCFSPWHLPGICCGPTEGLKADPSNLIFGQKTWIRHWWLNLTEPRNSSNASFFTSSEPIARYFVLEKNWCFKHLNLQIKAQLPRTLNVFVCCIISNVLKFSHN